ncbi:hypothetical protein LguiB_008031 [Lonicera macranthoides]
MGHMLVDGSSIWSKIYSFKSSPYPGQDSLQRIIIGDMGKAERDGSNEFANYQPGSLITIDQLINDLDNYNIVFHIGDLPYANGYISQWDQFTAQVQPITSAVPYMIASSNHERDLPWSGSFYDTNDSGGVNQCVNSEKSAYSGIVNGTIHVVTGRGGSHLLKFADIQTSWGTNKDHDFGFVKLTASNHSSVLFENKKSTDGKVYDSFTISRDYGDVLACMHDDCESTTKAE